MKNVKVFTYECVGLVVLLVGVFSFSLAQGKTATLSDADMASVIGGACNEQCSDQVTAEECHVEEGCAARVGKDYTLIIYIPIYQCESGSCTGCSNTTERICALIYWYEDEECTIFKGIAAYAKEFSCP